MQVYRQAVRGGAIRVGALFAAGLCIAGSSNKITPYPPDWPHRAPWKLSKELLVPTTERICFVVDVARGLPPKQEALDHLVDLAAKYSERPASWVFLDGPEAPRIVWTSPHKPPDVVPTVILTTEDPSDVPPQLSADVQDSLRYFNEVPSCPASPSSDTTYVFIRYLGKWGGSYGMAATVEGRLQCAARQFHVIYLAQDEIALRQAPGFSRTYLETRALVHEYGHALGLATNPAHGRWSDTIAYRGGPHCINRECGVAIPTAKALIRGWMLDYCNQCQKDIEQAKRHWQDGIDFPEVPRLPQPDLGTIVARLKPYQFRLGGEAERLVRYGKVIMPFLMDRMSVLPGSGYRSPRYAAAIFAQRIIEDEDQRRRPYMAEYGYVDAGADRSELLLKWWTEEGEAFLAGDDWGLPEGMLVREARD